MAKEFPPGSVGARAQHIIDEDRDSDRGFHPIYHDERATLGYGPAPEGRFSPSSLNTAAAYRANLDMYGQTGDPKYLAAARDIDQSTRGTERDRPQFEEKLLQIRASTGALGSEEDMALYNSTRDTTKQYLEAYAKGKDTIGEDYPGYTGEDLAAAGKKKSEGQSQQS